MKTPPMTRGDIGACLLAEGFLGDWKQEESNIPQKDGRNQVGRNQVGRNQVGRNQTEKPKTEEKNKKSIETIRFQHSSRVGLL